MRNTFPYKTKRESGESISNLLFQFLLCSWLWSVDFLFHKTPEKKSHLVRSGLRRGYFVGPRLGIHRPGKLYQTGLESRCLLCGKLECYASCTYNYVTYTAQSICSHPKQSLRFKGLKVSLRKLFPERLVKISVEERQFDRHTTNVAYLWHHFARRDSLSHEVRVVALSRVCSLCRRSEQPPHTEVNPAWRLAYCFLTQGRLVAPGTACTRKRNKL